jgi:Tfp pilus assembly protein FimT
MKGMGLSTACVRISEARSRQAAGGFTLLELTIVMVLAALTLGFGGLSFSGYYRRTAASNAAHVFMQDLVLARTTAVRTRQAVVIRFYESQRWYLVETQSDSVEVIRRRFGDAADIDLSAITLAQTGDSLVFSSRGIATITGTSGALGEATFSSGTVTYTVYFNSMGSSKIE